MRARALAGETVVGFETERVRKDGRRMPIAMTLSPIRDPVGRVVGISTIERDISTLKRFQREREEWSAVVAHDLRQPAAAIRLSAESLSRSEANPNRQRVIERIRKASDRLERMIGDLLDVSRIEAGQLAVHAEPVDLRPLVADVVALLPGVESRCRIEIDPDAERAWVDAERLVQVLSNLLTNAFKYGDPDTPVDVSLEPVEGMVQVSVTNEGPGISPDEVPKLFSRFARTRAAQSGGVPGLGLGLYICRGIVEAHGGRLWVESVPGDKTHFRFTLPRAEEGEPARPRAPRSRRPAAP
jgi:signal transduction histidine kinase